MNIMKIVHNLRQLVVFSYRFKGLSLPVQKQCKQERGFIEGKQKILQQSGFGFESCKSPGHVADGTDVRGRLCGVSSSVVV